MRGELSVRARLIVLVLSVVVPTAVISGYGAVWAWQTGRQATERALRQQARGLAADIARELDISKAALLTLATSPTLAAGDFEAFHRQLALVPKPDGARIVLTDASGQMRLNSLFPYGTALPKRGDLGIVDRVLATGQPQVSDLYVDPVTGEQLVAVDVPVEIEGRVAYDLDMGFAPAVLARLLEHENLGEGRLAAVVDGKGVIVAGHGTHIGQRTADASLAALARGKTLFAALSQEGQPLLAANARVPGTSWSVLVAARRDVIEAALLRSLAATAIAGAGVLAFGLLFAAFHARRITRPLGSLAAAAEALGQGRMPAATLPGVREASQVGAALTAAAAAIRDRENQRDAAEAALRESEARFRTVAEAMPGFVWTADDKGNLDYASPRWQAYSGRDLQADDGQGWSRSVHPDDRPAALACWSEAVAARTPYEMEFRLRRADDAYLWWLARALPSLDETTGAVRWIGICTELEDIVAARETLARSREDLEQLVEERTAALMQAVDALHAEAREREQAEAQLRQVQKMEAVGQLTGGIAHDFNNMLQGVSGSLELMQRRIAQGRAEEAGRFVDAARKTVERAAALTHRLLAFARRQTLQPRAVEPDELVEGMAELIRRTVGPEVEVELRMGNGIWTVLCDPNQLENVLLNLAINARDAMPGGGRLTIGTEDARLSAADAAGLEGAEPGDYVEISVADTGTGMDEATRERAFEPFFTTKPLGQGTGLGLSQLYGFVQQSGGFVRLDSAPGRGTAVRLYLPRYERVQRHEAGPMPGGGNEGAGAGEAVLLVEDEAGVRAVAAERLRELGYGVLEAADGPAALRLLRSGTHVDMLVTDVGLPGGLNGRQVAEVARERRPGLPVLFITGYAGSALDGQLAPGMEVIGKPFALDALAARVRAMLKAAPAP